MAVQSLPNLLRPLERGVRSEDVIQELEQLSRLSRPRLQERIREARLQRETLVSLARTFLLADDRESANLALERLIRYASADIRKKLLRWHIPTQDQENVARDVLVGMIQYWQDTRSTEAFWECNFVHCFNQRIQSLIQSALSKSVRAQSLSTIDEGGDEQEREDWLIDTRSLTPIDQAALNHGLNALDKHNAQWGMVFHAKYILGLKEEEIAADQGVSSRTIRTRLREAERFLQTHLREERV